jgi:hypothetical protein
MKKFATSPDRELTEAEYDELSRWAEQDFDETSIRVRPGRPSISNAPGVHSPRVATRVSARVKQLLIEKAASQGETPSSVIRRLVEEYVGVRSSDRSSDNLVSIPGMRDSIIDGMATPAEELDAELR